jgi:hypothetical protein
VLADPAPKGKNSVSRRGKSGRRTSEAGLITEPLTAELIDELGAGGPWKSDDEFEHWTSILSDARRDDAA